ncbi:MAG TPA: cysteine--tRNA ligase [Candidatus Limnocylindrales bacterium]|nr:cysteine--tRNA ligase [Candidatus Limnocylindrales bacterium]
MTLRLRNTLTRTVEPVEPSDGRRLRMYSCGPTVYRYAHVGNLRTFLLADLIRRSVLYHGIDVFQVQNITDVGHLRDERFDRGEDRMLVAAGLEHKTTQEIADAYEAAFHADAALLNLLPAHVFPRATDHIPEMLDLGELLVDKGHAYVSDQGNVYYDTASFEDYGRLSGNTLDALRAGHRGEVESDKRDPADFALWKAAGEGRLLKWPTKRWGEGYPGWHLECSAMALKHLGPRFDVHTGGIDNVFPHHEDEIAQSAPVVGGPPARVWVHGEFLQVGGQKMAKSAGNIDRIADVADRGVDPLAFRYLALTSRYRHKLEYTPDSLAAAAAGLDSLRERLRSLGPPPGDGPWQAPQPLLAGEAPARPKGTRSGVAGHGSDVEVTLTNRAHQPDVPLSAAGRALHDRFADALDDDLDVPTALAAIREAVRAPIADDERRWLVLDADFVLGLDLHEVWTDAGSDGDGMLPAEIVAILEQRTAARNDRDFTRADELRGTLAELGWDVVDGAEGSTVRRRLRLNPARDAAKPTTRRSSASK